MSQWAEPPRIYDEARPAKNWERASKTREKLGASEQNPRKTGSEQAKPAKNWERASKIHLSMYLSSVLLIVHLSIYLSIYLSRSLQDADYPIYLLYLSSVLLIVQGILSEHGASRG